jgi:hypothetical protein
MSPIARSANARRFVVEAALVERVVGEGVAPSMRARREGRTPSNAQRLEGRVEEQCRDLRGGIFEVHL